VLKKLKSERSQFVIAGQFCWSFKAPDSEYGPAPGHLAVPHLLWERWQDNILGSFVAVTLMAGSLFFEKLNSSVFNS
jgi:hypothetical protein